MTTSQSHRPENSRSMLREAELRWGEQARAWIRGERRVLRPLAHLRFEVAGEHREEQSRDNNTSERKLTMITTKPPVVVDRIYGQRIDGPRRTAEYLAIVRAHEVDGSGRTIGRVPNRVFVGSSMEHRDRSGVVLRARGTLYVHFERSQSDAIVALIASRLRASGYSNITFADPVGRQSDRPVPATLLLDNREAYALGSPRRSRLQDHLAMASALYGAIATHFAAQAMDAAGIHDTAERFVGDQQEAV